MSVMWPSHAEEVRGHERCLLLPGPRELYEQWIVVRMILQLDVPLAALILATEVV